MSSTSCMSVTRGSWSGGGEGGGVIPYMDFVGMYGPKGHGFSAVLVIDRVSILAILVLKGYGLVH